MDLLIILTYTAICVVVFKIFKIPLNKWSVPTAALGGVALITALMMLMNYNHPYAKSAKEVFVTVPIVPQVSGVVVSVLVQPNVPVKKGDVLYEIDSSAQQIALKKAEAALAEAKSGLSQKDAALEAAIAITLKAKTALERAETTFRRYEQGHRSGGKNSPFSQQQVDNREKLFQEAKAAYQAAQAEEKRLALIAESKNCGGKYCGCSTN